MNEKGEEKKYELEALTNALFRAVNEFNNALEGYKENDGKLQEDYSGNQVWNLAVQTIQKYNLSLDTIIEALPPIYRPIAKVMKKMPVDQVIDIVSDIAKEYAKDENGNYRSLEETLMRVAGKRFFRRIFK